MLLVGYFIIRSIIRASCGPRYYGQIPPPAAGYGPGPDYYGPGPGYGYGAGGWGPGYHGGGGGIWPGVVGGLGGAWLGNEMFGQQQQQQQAPQGVQPTTFDQTGNMIDPSTDPSGGQAALGDGGGNGR